MRRRSDPAWDSSCLLNLPRALYLGSWSGVLVLALLERVGSVRYGANAHEDSGKEDDEEKGFAQHYRDEGSILTKA